MLTAGFTVESCCNLFYLKFSTCQSDRHILKFTRQTRKIPIFDRSLRTNLFPDGGVELFVCLFVNPVFGLLTQTLDVMI